MAESCPTCGQAVELYTGSEGTSSYVRSEEQSRLYWQHEFHKQQQQNLSLRSLLVEAREALEEIRGSSDSGPLRAYEGLQAIAEAALARLSSTESE